MMMLPRILSKISYRKMSSNSAESCVLTSKNGKIFSIFINRPERKNCVNHATALQLIQAFNQFEKDDEADIAILSGKGGTFCAGYDLKEVSSGDFMSVKDTSDFLEEHRFMGPSMMQLSKPLIAAIEGYAVAGGLEMALLADLRVAATNSQFGVLCRRFGVPLIDGGTIRLPAAVGFSRAMDLILTGRQFDAIEAEKWGLVNRLAEPGQAYIAAEELAKQIIRNPQACLRVDRKSAYYAAFEANSLKDAFDFELNNGITVLSESIKGAERFVKKQHKL